MWPNRTVGEAQTHPKLQQLVAELKKRQQEEVEVRAKAEGTDGEAEVAQAKKRAVEGKHGRIYQSVVAKRERHMERAVRYQSLRYIRDLDEAGQPQDEVGAEPALCSKKGGKSPFVPSTYLMSWHSVHCSPSLSPSGPIFPCVSLLSEFIVFFHS